MFSIHKQAVPPVGVAHAVSARLTPSCLDPARRARAGKGKATSSGEESSKLVKTVRNLVTALNNHVQIYEIVEERGEGGNSDDVDGIDRASMTFLPGNEAQEDPVASTSKDPYPSPSAQAKLRFVREHVLNGIVTDVQRVQTIDSARDGLDRLLISFKDAKMTLLEWSPDLYDLVPVSLHTFEKLPHLMQGDLFEYRSLLRTDPQSRCAALLLPQNALAITPFFQDQIELEGADSGNVASLPYAPSSVIELQEISTQLNHTIDFAFLPGFNEPTLAIIAQPMQTWASRIENAKDTVSLFLLTLDVTSSPPSSTIISTTTELPYDCLYLTPCPKDLGGVLITSPDAIVHVDQSGKRVALAFNSKTHVGNEQPKTESASSNTALALEGSSILFIANEVALIFLRSGEVRAMKVQRDGRSISKLELLPEKLGDTATPSHVELVRSHLTPKTSLGATQACYAFVSSMLGDSELYRIDYTLAQDSSIDAHGPISTSQQPGQVIADSMDVDEDDIDIYGSADAKEAAISAVQAAHIAATTRLVLRMELCHVLPSHGPIRSAVVGTIEPNAPPELVACTGDERQGGLTIIHRSFLPSNRRTVNLDHPTERIWTVKLQADDSATPRTYLFTSADRETQIYALSEDMLEPDHQKTFGKTTLAVGSLGGSRYVGYLLQDRMIVLDTDLKQCQVLQMPDESIATGAQFTDPYVLVTRKEAGPLLYMLSSASSQLEQTSLPDHVSPGTHCFIYSNEEARHTFGKPSKRKAFTATMSKNIDSAMLDNDDEIYGDSHEVATPLQTPLLETMPNGDNSEEDNLYKQYWLASCDEKGDFRITSLEDGSEVFFCAGLYTYPTILDDSPGRTCEDDRPEDVELEQLCIFDIGQDALRLGIALLMDDGSLIVYEGVPDFGQTAYRSQRPYTLGLRFNKTYARPLGAPRAKSTLKANGSGIFPPERKLQPLCKLDGRSGLLITGETPLWILAEDYAASRLFDSAIKPIYSLANVKSDSEKGFLISTGEETIACNISANICLNRDLPFEKVVRGRLFAGIAFHQASQSYAAISDFSAPFEVFDDEGEPLHPNQSEDPLEPTTERSAIELIEPGSWRTVDGYEFRQYETALCIETVQLETRSAVSGFRDFIAVGTIVSRGEDLAARGAMYIFEIVLSQPARGRDTATRQLRMLFMEDLKSAVATVGALNGYVMHSVGLKLFAKALEEDERLLAVGFHDAGAHTTSIRAMKNLILLGDALRGVSLLAFQEDPYKLVPLGRELRGSSVATVDFLVADGKMLIVSMDMHGVMRTYEYDPLHPETQAGQRLLLRTEYQLGTEPAASIPFARTADGDPKQSGILYLNHDGSMSTLLPVKEAVYKRLQLLERQMIRHTHHFAGLNPKAYRTVHNAYTSRPFTKGILNGDLLVKYALLSYGRQQSLADPLGSDADTINYNLRSLKSPW